MTDSQTHVTADTAEQTRDVISITHTNEDGTLVVGTKRGDGSRDALRAARFRWSRRLGMWFMPQSRGRAARRARIDQLAGGLRDAGFDVKVQIEEYDPATAFKALQGAASERSDRLAERAEKRSVAAGRQAARRESPIVMGRKVERLEAEERSLKRILQTATGTYADRMRERHQEVQAEIDFFKDAIRQSGARQYTAADFQVGDLARVRGKWREVARVNRKTLGLRTDYSWTDNYPYHEVTGRRAAGDTDHPTAA
jgi:hypothetical protein